MNSSTSTTESGTTSVRNDDGNHDDLGQDALPAARANEPPINTNNTAAKGKRMSSKKKKTSSSRHVLRRKQQITVGCRGDPRMNEAVFLRLANPQLSLTDALLRGGFTFGTQALPPPPGILDRNVLDDDGVSLQQRKNQLMRRLRKDRDRKKKKKKEAEQKQKGGEMTAVQNGTEQTAASGADGEYYSRINNRKRRKTKPSEEDGGGADGSNWQYPAFAAVNDDGRSTASTAADGSIDHAILGGPTILDRLTALEQVQSALRMNAEMQRQILVEQQQRQRQRPVQQDDVDNDDQGKKLAADDGGNNKPLEHAYRDNPSHDGAMHQEVQELQNNLQRLIEDVLVTESDRRDYDMLKDHMPDSAAAATLTATAAAAQHMHSSANTSRGCTSSLKATQAVHPMPMAVQQPLITALPTLFGPGGTCAGVGMSTAAVGGRVINVPNIIGTGTGTGTGTGIAMSIGATATAPAPPAPPPPPPTATIMLTGGQYVDQNMLQQQMAAFQRQQAAAFAELAAAAAASSRQHNT